MEMRELVLEAVSTVRCGAAATEAQLHEQILDALFRASLAPEHEVTMAKGCRIDVLCGGIGIEIKKSRPVASALVRQLARYAACPQIEELIVIAPRGVNLPRAVGGKRVTMLALERLWGISLP